MSSSTGSSSKGFTGPVVIGLEIHVQLDTKTKLFCGCTTKGKEPNTATCPTCLGHPGSKPVLNAKALEFAAMLALALNCTINKDMRFSRKTYFYPDMGKNYQITQYESPLGENGVLELDDRTSVRIKRVHVEEDPAALVRPTEASANYVMVDYNRSGIPLVEIVTEPDMTGAEQAREFIKKLIHVLKYLKVFDENEGIIKADANVSIKETGYTRVEIKNITGAKEIERALVYEIGRQHDAHKRKETIVQETRGWDADVGVTREQRRKETEDDYGHITDPDLPGICFSDERLEELAAQVPELGQQKQQRFVKEYGIDPVDAATMAKEQELGDLFERVAQSVDPILAARWLRRELRRVLTASGKKVADVEETHVLELLQLLEKKTITDRIGQRLIERLVQEGISPAKVVKDEGLAQVTDEAAVRDVVKKIIEANPDVVKQVKAGEEKAFNFLIGQAMRQLKGRAPPALINKTLKEALEVR